MDLDRKQPFAVQPTQICFKTSPDDRGSPLTPFAGGTQSNEVPLQMQVDECLLQSKALLLH